MRTFPICGVLAAAFSHGDAFSPCNTAAPVSNSFGRTGVAGSRSMPRDDDSALTAAVSVEAENASGVETELRAKVIKLRRVLAQEYITFFDPMVSSWYAPDVTFDDPLTSLSGVDSYRKNVDMLAGRTSLGKFMFDGAGIALHSVTGGAISNGKIEQIITRWTLKVTVKALPWKPEAVFSGVSVYDLEPGGKEGILIVGQKDYWDSIDLKTIDAPVSSASWYQRADKVTAVQDFLGQLRPDGFIAPAAAPELPYILLRRGDGYEVRRYPGNVGIETTYDRRDFGFGHLGAFAQGMNPLAPSLMTVFNNDGVDDGEEEKQKVMMWPLLYAAPGEGPGAPTPPQKATDIAGEGQWRTITLASQSERVVAVRSFDDVSVAQVVKAADRELRALLQRDGLVPFGGTEEFVKFAQYDAVHSMGKRRSEVWIDLKDGGHPF